MLKKFSTENKEMKYAVKHFMERRAKLPLKQEIIYEELDWEGMNEVAAYGGFPTRYPHWQFGMEYERLQKSFAYGLHRIYEMVINNFPPCAYLLDSNKSVDQKLVMAHVSGHVDFFENNIFFADTNRKALDMFANHASRVRQLIDQKGEDEVEAWLDVCLSLEDLIDFHHGAIKRQPSVPASDFLHKKSLPDQESTGKFTVTGEYMDQHINPPEVIKKEEDKRKAEKEREKNIYEKGLIFPAEPSYDVLGFLCEHAPLEDWQREILEMIRAEAYYFVPQAKTKIMNEGWATYWHSYAMTRGLLTDAEVIDYADHHSGTVASSAGRLNPYKLGLELWKYIKDCWDRGAHGKIYEECEEAEILANWDQFVIFKNLFEESGVDAEKLKRSWQEFLCFWRAIKSGSFGIPQAIYERRKLIFWWDQYHKIDKFLSEIDTEISCYTRELKKHNHEIELALEKKEENRVKHFRLEKVLIEKDLHYAHAIKKFLSGLLAIRHAYCSGSLEPESWPWPEKFLAYAQKFPGKIPVCQGREKMFEVRRHHCDLTFLEEFMTEEFVREQKLFAHAPNKEGEHIIFSREFDHIKQIQLLSLENAGNPLICVTNGNFNNRGELLLKHCFNGFEMFLPSLGDTLLKALFKVWQRPVYLETVIEKKRKTYGCNGKDIYDFKKDKNKTKY